ncbi:hypothetical protein GCM10022243_07080 [Saccharothrix violaceirubra]
MVVGAVVLALVGVASRVIATDPVGYGFAFWPFANHADLVEHQVMDTVSEVARSRVAPQQVPAAVVADGVEVVRAHVGDPANSVWMTLRIELPDGDRCREVVVLGEHGVEINSRRVSC